MSQEELDLFQLSTIHMTEFCASPAEIMRSNMIQSHPLRTPPNDVPNDVLRDPFTPWRTVTADGPENSACGDLSGGHPAVDCDRYPKRHRHSPNLPALAHAVHDQPMFLPDL